MTDAADVLVIGAGPAGAAAAYWLAAAGHRVVVVERRTFPRSKACGDLVTPRAVQQLEAMGLGDALERWHRVDAIRLVRGDRTRRLAWPEHHDTATHSGGPNGSGQSRQIIIRQQVKGGRQEPHPRSGGHPMLPLIGLHPLG